MGSVPDGAYRVYNGALTVISDWTPKDRQKLADELSVAQAAGDAVAAKEALKARPDLFAAIQALIMPTTPAEFWTMAAAILAALMFLAK